MIFEIKLHIMKHLRLVSIHTKTFILSDFKENDRKVNFKQKSDFMWLWKMWFYNVSFHNKFYQNQFTDECARNILAKIQESRSRIVFLVRYRRTYILHKYNSTWSFENFDLMNLVVYWFHCGMYELQGADTLDR